MRLERKFPFSLFVCLALIGVMSVSTGLAQSQPPRLLVDAVNERPFRPAPEVTRSMDVPRSLTLPEAETGAVDALRAMREWNAAGKLPLRNGIERQLPVTVSYGDRHAAGGEALSVSSASDGRQYWGTVLRVAGADRLRLHLSDVDVPEGTTMWVWGDDPTQARMFGLELRDPEGGLWTPSVAGEVVHLEMEMEGGREFDAHLNLNHIAELFDMQATPKEIGSDGTECMEDATCNTSFDSIEALRKSVGHLQFISGSSAYICTGALINASANPDKRFMLTANHCISNGTEAASLEVFWDYRSSSCYGAPPSLWSLPRSTGATIAATSPNTDVTLLSMHSLPGGRWLLGWNASSDAVIEGTLLHRVSHPGGVAQRYSTSMATRLTGACNGIPRPRYIYSIKERGATSGGSSGAPVVVAGGYIVGQLYGSCGSQNDNPCGTSQTVDGALSSSWPVLQPHLSPQPTTCSACVPDARTACLVGDRFKVTMPRWVDSFSNTSGAGSVITYAENREEIHPTFGPLSEAAFFSMYPSKPFNIEMLLRIIKGLNLNNKYWVFITGFTGAEYTVRVQDTKTCAVWERTMPSGSTEIIKDFEAFPLP